ncbi:glycosyltransferase [Herbaspirillum sp. AP02]|uniref:glycosyltransferase family 2 protein n=1 Tax=unclassified Herbaspirillum TaxID=2624150 RepID=UPI0015DB7B20|nr:MULTISPECIES: glycosyltransferase family 2 protein [unclassified Herbaspirillum]MBG7618468.1 glycosyltransferase [Herbaspirillum sp. AP02]NZD68628.1 glycosyltransferase [Herbaspirillum sp. AP21]
MIIVMLQMLLLAGLVLLAIPVLVLLVQVFSAHWTATRPAALSAMRPRIAVLVPAHNEAGGIGEVVAGIRSQLVAADRLLVVADNCSDQTAHIAREASAEVTERFHEELRGKGYALDHGIRQLAADAPDVVIIVDADCYLGAQALETIARTCVQSNRPVQALYLMHAPEGGSPMRKIAEFAWLVKNLVRPLGFQKLGQPCQLMGTGMAFTWQQISQANLATGHIVEDMKLGVDLAEAGQPPLFCPEAMVYSFFPSSDSGVSTQRTRWEHGHLSVIQSYVPRLLAGAVKRRNAALAALALDLSVPPLALLVMLVVLAWGVNAVVWLVSGLVWPLLLSSLLVVSIGVSVLLAWSGYGRKVIGLGELLGAFGYVARKLPLYVKFLFNRQVAWVRSKRDSE